MCAFARKLLACAAGLAGREPEELAHELEANALVASSTKRGLDIDWNDPAQKRLAVKLLVQQIDRLEAWVREYFSGELNGPPLGEHLETLAQIRDQDLEPDPQGGGPRIRRGVAEDRRVSIEDPEMRHGRKTKSRTFNGYKSHLGADLDTGLILACGITPANRPESEALAGIEADIQNHIHRNEIGEMHIDRAYVASETVLRMHEQGVSIVAKPWRGHPRGFFEKRHFKTHLGRMTISCPAGNTQKIKLGTTVRFPAEVCAACRWRPLCTDSENGRSVSIAPDERLQKKLRLSIADPEGRQGLRQRVAIEHRLSHHRRKQGTQARYLGVRKNLFDARRHAVTINLETIHLANAA